MINVKAQGVGFKRSVRMANESTAGDLAEKLSTLSESGDQFTIWKRGEQLDDSIELSDGDTYLAVTSNAKVTLGNAHMIIEEKGVEYIYPYV